MLALAINQLRHIRPSLRLAYIRRIQYRSGEAVASNVDQAYTHKILVL